MQGWLPPEIARSRWQPTAAERRQLRQEAVHWRNVRRIESRYGAQLRRVAAMVVDIIEHYPPTDFFAQEMLESALRAYSDSLDPWARAVAAKMIAEVSRRDAVAWFRASREIGSELHKEIFFAPIGDEVARILEDQVALIRSIPIEAGRRVQEKTREHIASGKRYESIAQLIRETHQVTRSRATLIARTETAKASSALVQARAKYVGAEEYIWHSVQDKDVRPRHKKLNGTRQRWDKPPVAEDPEWKDIRHHPGEFPNCRCFAEPILPKPEDIK